MKPQKFVASDVRPVFEVYDATWRWIGNVEDRGSKVSGEIARERFGAAAVHVLPALVEVAK